jgi:hypothetical protein
MNDQTEAATLPRGTQLVVTISMVMFLVAASFQSAWAQSPLITLGSAKSFAVLGASTVTNTGPSTIYGDLGVSPGSAVTGFPPGLIVAPGTLHAADMVALNAQIDVVTAYNLLASKPCDQDLTDQDLGGKTLVAGVYCFSSSAQLTGTVKLDAQGNANAVFIFKTGSTLITASNANVKLLNGAQSCNAFWQVGSSATVGTYTSFIGNILALTSITVTTGASLNGRALARNGAVTLDNNNIFFSSCTQGTTDGGDIGSIPGSGGGGAVAGPGPVCIDIKGPKHVTTTVIPATSTSPTQTLLTVRDADSGLASIVVTLSINSDITIPAFAPGTTGPVIVTTTKITAGSPSGFDLKAIDVCGNVTIIDPVDFIITANKTVTLTGLPQEERFVTIANEGLQALIITVNDDYEGTIWLKPATTRTINILRAMNPGHDNTITFEAIGFGKSGKAQIFVHPK